jgi:hypothetical protein
MATANGMAPNPVEPAVAEQPHLHHGFAGAQLPQYEQQRQHQGGGELREGDHVGPAPLRGLDDRVDDGRDGGGGQQRAEDVEPAEHLAGRGGHDREHGDECGGDEGHVDPEGAAPAERLQQRAAGDRADQHADAGRGGPDAERLGPLVRREHAGDDRQGGRHDERRAETHDRPPADELGGGAGEPGDRRAAGEDDQAADERAPRAHPHAEAAGQDQRRGEDQRVRVGDPLQVGGGGLQRPGERRQRGVEHRVVQRDGHEGEAENAQCGPAPRVGLQLLHRNAP